MAQFGWYDTSVATQGQGKLYEGHRGAGLQGENRSGAGASAADGKGDQFALRLEGCSILTSGGGLRARKPARGIPGGGSAYLKAGWVKPVSWVRD